MLFRPFVSTSPSGSRIEFLTRRTVGPSLRPALDGEHFLCFLYLEESNAGDRRVLPPLEIGGRRVSVKSTYKRRKINGLP